MKSFLTSSLHQQFPRVPLRWVLIVPFVLQTVGAVGLVAYVSYRSGQRAVEDLAYQLIDSVGDRINLQLEDYLEIPLQINQLNANFVELGQLDVQNEVALEFRLWNQLIQFEPVGAVMFLSPDGRFYSVHRADNAVKNIDITTANFADSLTMTSYRLDPTGRKQEVVAARVGADLRRDRPWYRQAVSSGKPGWSQAYPQPDTGLLAINAYHPVYQPQTRELLGVFSVTVTLAQISQFLTSIDQVYPGELFILAPDGRLIASSADPQPLTTASLGDASTRPTRLTPKQSRSSLIRSAHEAAQKKFGSLYWLGQQQRATIQIEGDRYFLQTFPLAHDNDLNWQVVVLLPEARFMEQIYDNIHTTVLLSVGTLGVAIALGFLTARWIARPIQQLSQASRALADGSGDAPVPEDSPIGELQVLSQSFKQTAAQLKSSLLQIKTALAESEAKFTKVFHNSPDLICIMAYRNGRFLDVNESFTRMSGYSRAEILHRTAQELNLSLSPEQDAQLQKKLAQTGIVHNFEYEYRSKSGQEGTTLLSLEFLELEGQVCVLTIGKDISERKQLERALQTSESKLSNILDSAIAAVTRLRVYRDGSWNIDHISAGSETISGYTPDELKADLNLWTSRILGSDWEAVAPEVYADIFAQRPGSYEYRFRHKNGSVCWFCQTNISTWDEAQNCWLVTAVTSDITTRKQTEALLETRERYLVALAQTQRHLLSAQDCPVDYHEILRGLGTAASASRAMLFTYHPKGQPCPELQSIWCADGVSPQVEPLLLHSTPLEKRFPRWAATLLEGGSIYGIAAGFPASERAILEAQGVLAILVLPLIIRGEIGGFALFVNETEARSWDLSEISFLGAATAAVAFHQEREQAKAALYASEATNRALIHSIPDLLIRMKRDGTYLNILNTGEVELYRPETAQVGCGIYEVLPFSQAQQRMYYTQLALQTGMMQCYEYALEIDDHIVYEEARIVPCDEDTVLVIVRDVSERRLAEEQLRKTEQWLQQFSYQAPANIYTVVQEPDGYVWFEYISSAVEAMQEVTVEAVIADARVLLDKIHPEDRAGYLAAVAHSGETLEPFAHEWRTVVASGQVKWLQGRSQPERRSNGATAWYGVVIDVTEQKHTEQALKQALQEIETHFEDAPLAIVQWDQRYRILRWSKQAEQIFGWTAEEVIGRTWQDISLVYADDNERVSLEIRPLLQGQSNNCAIQNRNYTKDGRVIDCEWYSSAVFDEGGKLVSVLSFAQDVTDRKQTEEALRQSEQLFREAFATSAFGISVRSPEGRYLQVNQAFCKMLGYTEAELLQLDYRAITHPDDQAIDPNNTIKKLVAGEIPYYHLEKRFLHKNGSTVWGLVSISLVRDLAGQPLYFVALIHNITDRKQAEAALIQSEERFRSAFHAAPIGMALIGLDDRCLRVNSMLCRMLDYTEAELLAHPGSSLVYPEDVSKLHQCISQTLSSPNRSAQAELRYLCRGGRIAWGLLSLSLVRDPQGHPLYCVAQIQDITERRAVDRMKKEFISIVSHELRTPLTAMQGALGLLITGIYDQKPESAKRMIQIAYQNSDRLVRLVNDILDLERLESGKIELVKTACDVEMLLQQAVEGVQAIADVATVQMVIEPISAQVWASSDAILQTLTNLLSNAIKFSPPHTVIHLAAHPQMESVLFEVRDQGRGIPEEKLTTIFEKFQQVDVSDSRQKGGTGLGLAICRSIVEQHGGEIWAESAVGSGSTFYFTLPTPDAAPRDI